MPRSKEKVRPQYRGLASRCAESHAEPLCVLAANLHMRPDRESGCHCVRGVLIEQRPRCATHACLWLRRRGNSAASSDCQIFSRATLPRTEQKACQL
jgi:hypothetical protein